MKLVPITPPRKDFSRRKGAAQQLVEEFMAMNVDCVKVENPYTKTLTGFTASVNGAARVLKQNCKAFVRNKEAYICRTAPDDSQ